LPLPLDHQVIVDRPVSSDDLVRCVQLYVHEIQEIARNEKVSVVHSIYGTITALAGCFGTWFYGIPQVITSFGRDLEVGATADPRYYSMLRSTLALAEHVTVGTDSLRQHIERRFGIQPSKVSVIPCGVDTTLFDSRKDASLIRGVLGIAPHDVLCLAIQSSFSPDKGLDTLIRALPIIRERHPEVRVIVLGHDDTNDAHNERYLLELLADLGIDDVVEFHGHQPHDRIAEYLAAADLFVDPRRAGNFSSSLLEALAMGTPVVTSGVASNLELIQPGINGRTFETNQPADLATNILWLLEERSRLHDLRRATQRWFDGNRHRYDYRDIANRVLAIYDRVRREGQE
jgi:glycosyltransferase involved in cell wall biosynthesis